VVFEARPSEVLTQPQIAAVPEEAWATARIKPIEAMRLLQFAYPVNDYLEAMKAQEPLPSTARRATWLVVWRNGYDMWRMPLTATQYHLLSGLVEGRTLGEVLMGATRGRHRARPEEVFQWFSSWIGEGMFAELILAPTRFLAAAAV
ncbi:MAG: hypothetical protein ACYCW6_29730, partial [Candidatus Xenobia bacterium]